MFPAMAYLAAAEPDEPQVVAARSTAVVGWPVPPATPHRTVSAARSGRRGPASAFRGQTGDARPAITGEPWRVWSPLWRIVTSPGRGCARDYCPVRNSGPPATPGLAAPLTTAAGKYVRPHRGRPHQRLEIEA